jgi:hypothetical protein
MVDKTFFDESLEQSQIKATITQKYSCFDLECNTF